MIIYIMRHGTTVWNERGITQGRSSNRLSRSGKELALSRAKELKNVKLDVIFASPLTRTIQTANLMNLYQHIKIIKDERLTEIDQGIFTGRKSKDLTEKEMEIKAKRLPETKMESYASVFSRVSSFLQSIKKEFGNKTVLIVTHNCSASLLELAIKNGGKYKDEYAGLSRTFCNAEVKKFVI